MQSPSTSEPDHEATSPAPPPRVIAEPDFSGEPVPIGQFTERANFPQCTLGVYVSIHGFTGVVVEIISQSLKVRSREGISQRFNAYRLKTLFAPPDRTKPVTPALWMERPQPEPTPKPIADEPEEPPPARRVVTNPDFDQPVRAIRVFATQADFPENVYGKHVDIPGYSGVVVEIIKGSLRVRSVMGTTRSYNVDALKKLYGRP